ncbi:hypothetical protein SASPL_112900 [Salvia splendens]|uniref:Uncharacterized protein n=1 Tax=Salvia splendens TaxID=180675 RepID=A0A8X8YDJ3_SALSN|nr:hypothetical protein SASPL_112900 [Salvia splendens]
MLTSDDTHSRTTKLLEENAYFGMKPSQVKMVKQAKPHGHGDVHSLLYSTGLLKEWQVPSALGVSAHQRVPC